MTRSGWAATRGTVLVLLDELKSTGLSRRTRTLIDAIGARIDPVVVAQTYLPDRHRARELPFQHALYGFGRDGYEARVRDFAREIIRRFAPDWVVAYGWENPQLILELDCLQVPVLIFVDHTSRNPTAEDQLARAFACADDILFADKHLPEAFTTGRWSLQARPFRIMPQAIKSVSKIDVWRRLVPGHVMDRARIQEIATEIVDAGTRISIKRRRDRAQTIRDEALIRGTRLFNTDLFTQPSAEGQEDASPPISRYLRQSRHTIPRDRIFAGRLLRRPLEGFHPLIYATDHARFDETTGEDPLAHYLRHGKPTGRWSHQIIRPSSDTGVPDVRVAVHLHIHYTDLFTEIIDRLSSNHIAYDLFVTTTSEDRRAEIRDILANTGRTALSLTTGSNRGRDVWPFLDLLGSGAFAAYDIVGHVHGKRSPNYALAALWRSFLWRHLIGGPERMMDAVASAFAADPKLGLVIPEDPYLQGWEGNLSMATILADRVGIELPLPAHFEFPVGTMFWARPAAVSPLVQLGLTTDAMPAEPLADDGTILHAVERLIPFVVTKAGYNLAATHVPGSVR